MPAEGDTMKSKNLRVLCEGAIMVALAQVLGYIKLFQLPQGGSITLAMLPIMVFCVRWGFKSGLAASFALGVLQLVLDGAYTWGWQSIIFDYILAYGILGTAGLFNRTKGGLFIGTAIAALLRLSSHVISGYFFVHEMTTWELYGLNIGSPWIYSILYNASYIIPSTAVVLLVLLILYKPLRKQLSPQHSDL